MYKFTVLRNATDFQHWQQEQCRDFSPPPEYPVIVEIEVDGNETPYADYTTVGYVKAMLEALEPTTNPKQLAATL